MEVTLEKIELVKDRTGVSYKEAKEALEAAEGNVVDAIISIEETVDKESKKSEDLIAKMKEIVNKGNVSRIMVKRDEDTILNIPLNAGIIGTLVAPWGMIVGVVAALGFKCKIEFVKDDGSVVDLSDKAEVLYDKAGDVFEDAKEKGTDLYEGIKEKAPVVYDDLKEKGKDYYNMAKDAASDVKDKIVDKKEDVEVQWEEAKDQAEDVVDEAVDKGQEVVKDGKNAVEDKAEDLKDAAEDKLQDLEKKLEEIEKELDK